MKTDDDTFFQPQTWVQDSAHPVWRTIETAPCDESIFLAFSVDAMGRHSSAPFVICFRSDRGVYDTEGYPISASHWMPLPNFPEGTAPFVDMMVRAAGADHAKWVQEARCRSLAG